MNKELRIKVIENKNNKQFTISLPKRKIPKSTLMNIKKTKYVKVKLV